MFMCVEDWIGFLYSSGILSYALVVPLPEYGFISFRMSMLRKQNVYRSFLFT